jgi:hypothetical protein
VKYIERITKSGNNSTVSADQTRFRSLTINQVFLNLRDDTLYQKTTATTARYWDAAARKAYGERRPVRADVPCQGFPTPTSQNSAASQ